MLIVGCQNCGDAKVLAGAPDSDGVARVNWTCPRCGTGQVLQLDVSKSAKGADLHSILGGFDLNRKKSRELPDDFMDAGVGCMPE